MRLIAMVAALSVCLASAVAQEPVTEGDVQKLVLAPAENARSWEPAEATMTTCTDLTRTGAPALRFHVEVDYNAGEKAYPIGWPRAYLPLKSEALQRWSDYDYLRLWVYTDTPRENLPQSPLTFMAYAPDRAHSYNRTLVELRKGEWVKFEIPTSEITTDQPVTRIGFSLAEANYRDHDVIDFTLDDIALVRYVRPTLANVTVCPAVAYSDATQVQARFQVLGVPEANTTATVALRQGDRLLAQISAPVVRGANSVVLDARGKELVPGMYEVTVRLGDGPAAILPLRIIESPWTR